mgnify:CR=1 FL=1
MKKENNVKTNAIRLLEQKHIDFKVHDYSSSNAISGMEVASYLNQDPSKVFKTLVTTSKSKTNYVFLVPVNSELDLKKASQVVNEKYVEMIKSKDLLPLTGYIHGGCSPLGMKKFFKTIIDSSAKNYSTIFFSAGKIGYQIETSIAELEKVISFSLEDIKE